LKRANILGGVVIAVTGLLSANTASAELKIGVVNAVKVLEAAPQTDEAKKRLEKDFSSRESKLRSQQGELKRKEEKLSKDVDVLSDSERRNLERDITSIRRELKRDQDEYREDLNIRRNEEFGKIQRQVVEAIQAIAKEDGFDIIMGEGVVFASERVDVTAKVVDRLKRGK
jgi:outer membrane protein